jgi:hypothetical protein
MTHEMRGTLVGSERSIEIEIKWTEILLIPAMTASLDLQMSTA